MIGMQDIHMDRWKALLSEKDVLPFYRIEAMHDS